MISKALIDPLHVKNNTWEKMNQLIVAESMKGDRAASRKKYSELAPAHPMKTYGESLKHTIKAGRVYRKFVKWYDNELPTGKCSTFQCRFTGEESFKYANSYMDRLSALMACEIGGPSKLRLHVIGYMCQKLVVVVVGMTKYDVTNEEALRVERCSKLFYVASALFFTVGLLEWTLAFVVPAHLHQCLQRFGVGLGIDSTQGRESKHQSIKSYKLKK